MKFHISVFYYPPLYILIRLWQSTRLIREVISLNNCRFYPSCSDYFLKALKVHGLIKGLQLSVIRFIKCQPLCHGGIDEINNNCINYGS